MGNCNICGFNSKNALKEIRVKGKIKHKFIRGRHSAHAYRTLVLGEKP